MAQNETKAEHQLNPVGPSNKQEHSVPNFTKNSVESDIRPTGVQLKKEAWLSSMIGSVTKHADCRILKLHVYPIHVRL